MHSQKTRVEYAQDWKTFVAWCRAHGENELPVSSDTLINYLSERLIGGGKVTTAARAVYAINDRHRVEGHPLPGGKKVSGFLTGVRRYRREQPSQKQPIGIDCLQRICNRFGSDPRHIRARAVLTLGFASALRRSNLVALDLDDVQFQPEGMTVKVRKSKTDQEGKGRIIGVAPGQRESTCPVRAMKAWLDLRGSAAGPIFLPFSSSLKPMNNRLHTNRIGVIIKEAVRLVGLDPREYAGHSLRSGFVTSAIVAGVGELLIAERTGHKSLSSLRIYYRNAQPFARDPCATLGL